MRKGITGRGCAPAAKGFMILNSTHGGTTGANVADCPAEDQPTMHKSSDSSLEDVENQIKLNYTS